MQDTLFDIAVIGGGMAGAAAAANLAAHARVLVLERESQPGYHATGRSAALFSEIYGNAPIRTLTRASRDFFYTPQSFTDVSLVSPRGALYIANAEQLDALNAFASLPDVAGGTRRIDATGAQALSSSLRNGYVAAALYEPDACDLDVHALHQGYLRQLRDNHGKLVNNAGVTSLLYLDGQWTIDTDAGTFHAKTIVNAAGAWVDEIATLAGAAPIGIQPLRRTAFMVDAPSSSDTERWPLTIDIGEQFYFKPDAGRLLLSPADETPSLPCDAWPEDMDIAIAVDRIERATTLSITHVQQKWAGLRSFVEDRSPVIGYDPQVADFFWIAALGGYGIQTAPAVGRLAAALIRHLPVPGDMLKMGLDVALIAPARLAN
ncbi:NAD(P)/FAD-dependent oxidoreductase [Rhodanobacter sp. Col0626]|uniref:NAD(P)/FAD-dependent oxidoreductase n=1 Tax=Rhodanobacter sp. Col0626 TaxID=3415679 RepID=UPI003CF6F494